MKKYKYISFYLTISLVFCIPLALKFIAKANKLEVYPSIVLPTGATIIKSNKDSFHYTKTLLFGYKNNNNKEKIINTSQFLYPILPHYIFAIYENDFGLNPKKRQEIIYRKNIFDTSYFQSNLKFSSKELKKTKKWYQQKLLDQGFNPNLFFAKKVEYETSIWTKKTINKTVLDEKVFILI